MWNLRIGGYGESWEALLDSSIWAWFKTFLSHPSSWVMKTEQKAEARACVPCQMFWGNHSESKDQILWDRVGQGTYLEFISEEVMGGFQAIKDLKRSLWLRRVGERKRRSRKRIYKACMSGQIMRGWLQPSLEWGDGNEGRKPRKVFWRESHQTLLMDACGWECGGSDLTSGHGDDEQCSSICNLPSTRWGASHAQPCGIPAIR